MLFYYNAVTYVTCFGIHRPISQRTAHHLVTLIITLIVTGLVATGAVFGSVKVLRARATKSINKDSESIKNQIKQLDNLIDAGIKHIDGMVSLDEVIEVQSGRDKINADLEVERRKLAEKEKELELAQGQVDQQEQRHSELKRGKEGSENMSQQIQDKKAQLDAESERLNAELVQSKSQLDAFLKENAKQIEPDQKIYMEETIRTLDHMTKQLKDLVEVHEQASQRFVNLQRQYTELEKEYRRLVDREISGTV